MKFLFFIFSGIEMTLLPIATLFSLLPHFFPCRHIRMEGRKIDHNDIIRLRDLDGAEIIHQNTVPHQIRKRGAG